MYLGTLARNYPDKPAAIRPSTGEVRTFRQINDRSNQLAQLLHVHGLRRGDHVAMYMENQLTFFDVIQACMRSGLLVTPINWHLPAAEAAYIVDNCDARVLIASGALAETAELGRLSPRCDVKLSVGDTVDGFADFETAIAACPADPLPDEWLGGFMLYSSGTTGKPKGILRALPDGKLTDDDGSAGAGMMADLFGIDQHATYLSPAPLYHSAPAGFTSSVIQAGGTVIVMDRFEAETALSLIERYKITHSQWVPTMFVRMLKLEPQVRSRYDLSSHRCAIHAAAPCPAEVKREMIAWWGPILEEFYSSTEMAGFARIRSQEWLEHSGSVGRSHGLPFHICDDDGRELPIGEIGTVFSESPLGIPYVYHKDDGKTVSSSHPEHPTWMTVGDVGYLDSEGYLYLTDRKSFMIISGGMNIYPQQIEDVLALHPKITDVAVIGVPNVELGEEVKAVVEPAPGIVPSEELAEEIKAFVHNRLGRQLTPRSVDFIDVLPRLPTGKLYKKGLRERYWPSQGGHP